MEDIKMYKNINPAEQLDWVRRFAEWVKNDWVRLTADKPEWSKELRQSMENGLKIISAFSYAVSFVEEALKFGDYHCRVKQMGRIIVQIKNDIVVGIPTKVINGQTVLSLSNLNTTTTDYERTKIIARMLGIKILMNGKEQDDTEDETADGKLQQLEGKWMMEIRLNIKKCRAFFVSLWNKIKVTIKSKTK